VSRFTWFKPLHARRRGMSKRILANNAVSVLGMSMILARWTLPIHRPIIVEPSLVPDLTESIDVTVQSPLKLAANVVKSE